MGNPRLYIIAGCNGAGKTTASMTVLPEILNCDEFVNADEIAKGLSPFHPETVSIQAGKLMLQRIDELMDRNITFAIETTLATRSYKDLVLKAKALGYAVILLFFWLPSVDMAVQRVAKRVSEGGHDIPESVIHRRYWLGIQNLFNIFAPIVDAWSLYDNSSNPIPIVLSNEIKDFCKFNKIKESCQNSK